MALLRKVLESFIKGEANNICCLCFNNETNMDLYNELAIQTGENEQIVSLFDIIKSLLGDGIHENVKAFDSICGDCAEAVMTFYKFIQTTNYNAMRLTQALDCLNQIIDEKQDYSKTLFMEINIQEQTIKHFYDNLKMESKYTALNRFKYLNTVKDKVKIENVKMTKTFYDPNTHLYKCKVCLKLYRTKWKMKKHYIKVHAPKMYKCPKCPKSFNSKTILEVHMNDNHCKVICSECGKSFNNKCSLLRHESQHKSKELVCSQCGRTYKSRLSYKNHIKSNLCKQKSKAPNAQFTCDYCNKKYTQKMTLRVHIQYEHGNYKGHICEWCGKKFWAQSRLKAHIVKHTGEKNFNCFICNNKFVTKESLLYHTRLHTGEKPYRCTECGSTFISASRKMYHMKTYHQAAAVECEICHCKFSSNSYLMKHKKCHEQDSSNNVKVKKKLKKENEQTCSNKEDTNIIQCDFYEQNVIDDFILG